MVIAYWIGEEIAVGEIRVRESYHLLSATEVGLRLIPEQLALCDEMA